MKLNPFENSRTFYSPTGNQKVIRDTFVNQNPVAPQKELKKEEPKVEVKMSGEPSLQDIQTEVTSSKQTRTKKTNNEKA